MPRDHAKYAELDIQLRRIVLTKDQIEEYDLPTAPDGESVELDVLEAIQPGVFEEIVREEIDRYRDPDLDDNVERAFEEFKEAVDTPIASHLIEPLLGPSNLAGTAE